jgi:hypothetical protein
LEEQAELATFFMIISSLAYSSTVKMEAIYSSEKSVNFERTTCGYIPGESVFFFSNDLGVEVRPQTS